MKLVSITFKQVPRLPGISAGNLVTIDIDNPRPPLRGWNIVVRGPMIILVSPQGWTNATATAPGQRNPKGPCTMHTIPMVDAYLQWEASADEVDAVLKGGLKYETGPIGPKDPVLVDDTKSLLAQIPAGQIGDA